MDSNTFRRLCGRFPTGVVVITARDGGEQPVGMTANSFTSVSLDPPLVSVSIDHAAELHSLLVAAPRFALNVLKGDQAAMSVRFAGPSGERFTGVGYRLSHRGNPLIDGVLAVLECERHTAFDAGDHTILLGRVLEGIMHDGRPLIFYEGSYYDGAIP